MKFYYHPLSTYSQKALFAMHEKELEFEGHLVNLMSPDEREAYREIYPLGKIPLLVAADERMIPESSIIIEYLDSKFDSGTRLIPDDPELARRTRFHDRMADLYLNEPVTTLLFQSWKPETERDPERIEKARFQLGVLYGFMSKHLQDHDWLNESGFSMADCSAAAALCYAGDVAPFDEHPPIRAYWDRVTSRDAYRKVATELAPFREALARRQAG